MFLLLPKPGETQYEPSICLLGFTEEKAAWEKKKRARRILSESRPKLTAFSLTGFGFLLVALAACGCQRASLLPFICAIISRQQASVAGGVELT